jgi:hypothetical protein
MINGSHTWYIKAVDNAGNSTNSETFNLTISCGGGIPIWLLNQTNQNQTDDTVKEDKSDEIKADKTEKNSNRDKIAIEQIKQKIFSYSKSRLKSLFQEQNLAKDLKI